MSKPLVLLCALVTAGVLAVTGVLWFSPGQNVVNVHFAQGDPGSRIFLPALPRKEERIIRHPSVDGSAVDDVLMRDKTTKRIVYDKKMRLREVYAYFKGATPAERGALMYEKAHDENGHLLTERHLRLDGSLEMDGHFNPDSTYVRHLYYPGTSADPKDLVVSAEQTFDKWWHPTIETDYRLDKTRKLVHTWGDGLDEVVKNFADDGNTMTSEVRTGRGKYYTALYYPDGKNIQVEAVNTYEGTTFQWYRPDHSLKLKVTLFQYREEDVLTSETGKLLIKQTWFQDYSQPTQADGSPSVRLDHFDHYNDEGNVDSSYEFDSTTHQLDNVTFYLGDSEMGARVIYTVGSDGFATSVKTFDKDNKDDGGKPVTAANRKQFVIAPWMVTHPTYVLPSLKEGTVVRGHSQSRFRDR